jgi:hypothetical protein
MAQELSTYVEFLAAAIQAVPLDRLGQSDAKQLALAIERPLEIPRTNPTPHQTGDLIHACLSCAAGAGACATADRYEMALCWCCRNRLGPLCDWASTRSPPQCGPNFLILMPAHVDFEVSTGCGPLCYIPAVPFYWRSDYCFIRCTHR